MEEKLKWSDPEKQRLMEIAGRVHNALRMLKLGEVATITCGRQFPFDEMKSYLIAYAFHKSKWFEVSHDKTSNALTAKRVPVPSFFTPEEEEEPDAL